MKSSAVGERAFAVVFGLVMLVTGLASRSGLLSASTGKAVGVVLWSALIYCIVVFCRPGLTVVWAGIVTLAVCWGIEFFQITGVPAKLALEFPPTRYVLGRAFHGSDLLWYAVGTLFGVGVHAGWRWAWAVRRKAPQPVA